MMAFVMAVLNGSVFSISAFFQEYHMDQNLQKFHTDSLIVASYDEHKEDISTELDLLSEVEEVNEGHQDSSEVVIEQEPAHPTIEETNHTSIRIPSDSGFQKEKLDTTNDKRVEIAPSPKIEESISIKEDVNEIDPSSLKEEQTSVDTSNQDSEVVEESIPIIHYDRTTSIYENDNVTLLRVEYYRNNKLTYYSVVERFDSKTKSYIEKIYQCDIDGTTFPLIRTDKYVNGNLVESY